MPLLKQMSPTSINFQATICLRASFLQLASHQHHHISKWMMKKAPPKSENYMALVEFW
eukprot:m.91062 g.91062  ORF g.91062 m.91062 type:complete len:58 (-) comp51118_c0_seq3:888-1061(-)